jgi:hypothetical protein
LIQFAGVAKLHQRRLSDLLRHVICLHGILVTRSIGLNRLNQPWVIVSGSTLLAAEETGRNCAGIELDPGYVEVAIRRWQKRTGKDAVHTVTGETFDEVCKRHAVSIVEPIEGHMPDVMDHDSEGSDD